jgi:predicted amino acid dehydrogenase
LTSGNSYTVAAARRAVRDACAARGLDLNRATVAVIGAAGMIGRALAILLAEEVGRLVLIGNPAHARHSASRLQGVAADAAEHVRRRAASGAIYAPGTVGDVLSRGEAPIHGPFGANAGIETIADLASALPEADIVITATSSPAAFVHGRYLKPNAIVCDVSRPFNVCGDVAAERPDVLVIEGGLVRVPGNPDFRFLGGKERGIIVACIAETILLALEKQPAFDGLCGSLNIETILELERLGERHGLQVVLGEGSCHSPLANR